MALMIGKNGKVVGIEHIPELVDLAKENTRKHHADLLENGQVQFVEGDGRKGYPIEQKYDAIHVGAAAETIPQPVSIDLRSIFFCMHLLGEISEAKMPSRHSYCSEFPKFSTAFEKIEI
ncbi:Protein-L-isoaspartate(D-aspartate) O-methyltransferase [Oesophagostomum dentatum]|uniref:protein-L-isoaspartate(D-aspartate) O-methyltransferase n=1 Tax=Oesophagostomum dentatum TaxID=61180 RepID=A0A0B1SK81_OESDE|nr:Protein-L-isoaspartate(D-aspartate) O-methyltransferase [Oesophagostomum dentatum]